MVSKAFSGYFNLAMLIALGFMEVLCNSLLIVKDDFCFKRDKKKTFVQRELLCGQSLDVLDRELWSDMHCYLCEMFHIRNIFHIFLPLFSSEHLAKRPACLGSTQKIYRIWFSVGL